MLTLGFSTLCYIWSRLVNQLIDTVKLKASRLAKGHLPRDLEYSEKELQEPLLQFVHAIKDTTVYVQRKSTGVPCSDSPRLLHKYIKERGRSKQSFLIGRSLRAVPGRVKQQGRGSTSPHPGHCGK